MQTTKKKCTKQTSKTERRYQFSSKAFNIQINLTEVSRGFYHYLLANVGTTACLKSP